MKKENLNRATKIIDKLDMLAKSVTWATEFIDHLNKLPDGSTVNGQFTSDEMTYFIDIHKSIVIENLSTQVYLMKESIKENETLLESL